MPSTRSLHLIGSTRHWDQHKDNRLNKRSSGGALSRKYLACPVEWTRPALLFASGHTVVRTAKAEIVPPLADAVPEDIAGLMAAAEGTAGNKTGIHRHQPVDFRLRSRHLPRSKGRSSPLKPRPPGEIVGPNIDRECEQHHKEPNPKQPRMMQPPPVRAGGLSLNVAMMASVFVRGHFLSL